MKRRTAFTLVELLVVIAVIALLMGILLPALGRARKQAQAIACRSNMKQWGLVFALYAQDNKDSFPQSYAGNGVNWEDAWMLGATLPYYKNKNMRMCPSTKTLDRPPAEQAGGTFIDWGPLPASKSGSEWYDALATGSYAFNNWCADPPAGVPFWPGIPIQNLIRKTSVKGTHIVPLVADSVYVDIAPKHTDRAPTNDEHQRDQYRASYDVNSMKWLCIDRHKGGINAVFVDMHVEHVGIKRLWKLKWHKNFPLGVGPAGGWPSWTDRYRDE